MSQSDNTLGIAYERRGRKALKLLDPPELGWALTYEAGGSELPTAARQRIEHMFDQVGACPNQYRLRILWP